MVSNILVHGSIILCKSQEASWNIFSNISEALSFPELGLSGGTYTQTLTNGIGLARKGVFGIYLLGFFTFNAHIKALTLRAASITVVEMH